MHKLLIPFCLVNGNKSEWNRRIELRFFLQVILITFAVLLVPDIGSGLNGEYGVNP